MPNREDEFQIESWEDDEYIICFKGRPIGHTLHKPDARVVKRWIGTALNELMHYGKETKEVNDGKKELIMKILKPIYWYCMTAGDRDLKHSVYSLFYPLIKGVEQDKKLEVKHE